MDLLLSALDAIIVASAAATLASAGVAVVGLATLNKPTATQARERRRRYRKMLNQFRSMDREGPGDRELRSILNAINLRRNSRKRTFIPAQVLIAGQHSPVSCSVVDISDTGARLAFADHVGLPDEIALTFPKANRRVRARVVWSKETTCGVEFLEQVQVSEAPVAEAVPLAQRVA